MLSIFSENLKSPQNYNFDFCQTLSNQLQSHLNYSWKLKLVATWFHTMFQNLRFCILKFGMNYCFESFKGELNRNKYVNAS